MIFFMVVLKQSMRRVYILLTMAVLAISSCSDEEKPSKDGDEQVPQPVENAGPNTEAQRAVEATVNDSTKSEKGKDSTKK
jgi:hypothetical protein